MIFNIGICELQRIVSVYSMYKLPDMNYHICSKCHISFLKLACFICIMVIGIRRLNGLLEKQLSSNIQYCR